MADTTKVCGLCNFYDETTAECARFPPVLNGTYVDQDGDEITCWDQPFIMHPWQTSCGEWQENNDDPLDAPDTEAGKAALARLQLIITAHEMENRENNDDRD